MQIPKWFKITSGKIGLRTNKTKDDFVVVVSNNLANCAWVFTKNTFFWAPIWFTKNQIANWKLQAIAIWAWNANVATWKQWMQICEKTAKVVSEKCQINVWDVWVAYTWIIGRKIEDELIENNLPKLLQSFDNDFEKAAKAIMTTDSKMKFFSSKVWEASILIFAKWAWMIHPNMWTMLAFILTDAEIDSVNLNQILRNSIDKTFNQTSVDWDMSTSDMVLIMANWLAWKPNLQEFQSSLDDLCMKVCKEIVSDWEWATKMIEIIVSWNLSVENSRIIASKIITSSLVKCAIFGSDPNWWRILAAAWSTLIPFNMNEVSLKICWVCVFENWEPNNSVDNVKLHEIMKNSKEILIELQIWEWWENARGFGCDLTNEYVNFNAMYHT